MTSAPSTLTFAPLTHESAMQRASILAAVRGWPWIEPVRVTHHRPLLGGRATTTVLTNAERSGGNVVVIFDTATGAVVTAVCCLR